MPVANCQLLDLEMQQTAVCQLRHAYAEIMLEIPEAAHPGHQCFHKGRMQVSPLAVMTEGVVIGLLWLHL